MTSGSRLESWQFADNYPVNRPPANLAATIENYSASEAVIRDVDMAAEMTTFTKNQILLQAGTAMLAQANLAPQQVLALFG